MFLILQKVNFEFLKFVYESKFKIAYLMERYQNLKIFRFLQLYIQLYVQIYLYFLY